MSPAFTTWVFILASMRESRTSPLPDLGPEWMEARVLKHSERPI
jgi:hypothetical protein